MLSHITNLEGLVGKTIKSATEYDSDSLLLVFEGGHFARIVSYRDWDGDLSWPELKTVEWSSAHQVSTLFQLGVFTEQERDEHVRAFAELEKERWKDIQAKERVLYERLKAKYGAEDER